VETRLRFSAGLGRSVLLQKKLRLTQRERRPDISMACVLHNLAAQRTQAKAPFPARYKGKLRAVAEPFVTVYAYARVSTDGQTIDAQVRQLRVAGSKKDSGSGKWS
jgi:hypothetical protein